MRLAVLVIGAAMLLGGARALVQADTDTGFMVALGVAAAGGVAAGVSMSGRRS